MQQSIAAVESTSTAENELVQSGRSLGSRLWSSLVTLGLAVSSIISGIVERFDSGISDSIDIDRMSTRLRVLPRARSEGEREHPSSNEESISGGQLEIVAHFKDLQRRAQRRVDISSEKTRRMREKIDLTGMEGAIRDIPSRCENDMRRMLAEWQSRLSTVGIDAVEQSEQHSQEKKADIEGAGQSLPMTVQLAFLAALVGVGAMLISKTSAFGLGADTLVPPVWTIVVLLIVVVLSSIVARAVSSSISHEGSFWKLRQWIRGGLGLAFAVLLALFASHYLLAMAASADTSWSAALGGVSALFGRLLVERSVPALPFDDWTVFSIVMAAALSTFVICYQPEIASRRHEAIHMPSRRTRKERARLIRQLRKVNMKIDHAEAEVTARLKKAKSEVGRYARLVEATRRLSAKLKDYDYVLENACNMLLDRYRAENVSARSSAAPPAFREHVCFRADYEASSAALADEGRYLDEYQQGIRTLEAQASQTRQELRTLNARAINALEEAAMT